MQDCIFCKIAAKQVPADIVFEDERAVAFNDINPQAPVHMLVIPKKHIVGIAEAEAGDAELIGHLQLIGAKLAKEKGISEGYRVVVNSGPRSGQTVMHLHYHVIGGRDMGWPPG